MFRRIRWRLLATYLVVIVAALVFLGFHLTGQFERVYTEQLEADLLDLARLIAADLAESPVPPAGSDVPAHLRAPRRPPQGPLVVVTDASGTVRAGTGISLGAIGRPALDPRIRLALAGAETTGVGMLPGGPTAIYAAVPISVRGRVHGVVQVGRPVTYLEAQIRHVHWVVGWATVLALLIAGTLGLLLARNIAAPVQEMQVVASHLAAGRLSERIPVRTRDELGDLARSLNYMAGELERMEHMRRAFIADASHELRTPVANLAVAVEALQASLPADNPQTAAIAADLERETTRLRALVEDLLDLSRVESGDVQLDLSVQPPGAVILDAVRPFRRRAEQAGVRLSVEIPSRLARVRMDPQRTVQVLMNLLDNALKHTPAGGGITVTASEQRGHVLVSVADTGPGIPESEMPHIFDRFYKVDKARTGGRGGAGLGLAIARRLVEAQGGIIMVESREGQGARFTVALPRES